jgi:hypothetical protein
MTQLFAEGDSFRASCQQHRGFLEDLERGIASTEQSIHDTEMLITKQLIAIERLGLRGLHNGSADGLLKQLERSREIFVASRDCLLSVRARYCTTSYRSYFPANATNGTAEQS